MRHRAQEILSGVQGLRLRTDQDVRVLAPHRDPESPFITPVHRHLQLQRLEEMRGDVQHGFPNRLTIRRLCHGTRRFHGRRDGLRRGPG